MRDYTLHLGVKRSAVKPVQQRLAAFTVATDGDGWEAWGEAPGTDVNDGSTLHLQVTIGGDDTYRAIEEARRSAFDVADLLVPMVTSYQSGVIAVLTDELDWSTVHLTIYATCECGADLAVDACPDDKGSCCDCSHGDEEH